MKRTLATLFVLTFLGGCDSAQDVELTLNKGDNQDYLVQTITVISPVKEASSHYSSEQTMQTDMIINMEVTQTSPQISLNYVPKVWQSQGAGSRFNSLDSAGSYDMDALYSKGFTLDVDPKTGNVVDFKSNNEVLWNEKGKEKSEQILSLMQKSFSTPGYLEAIPATLGAKLPLSNIDGTASELEVVNVTDDTLEVQVSSLDKQVKLFGKVILQRSNGWIKEAVMVSESTLDVPSYGQFNLHTTAYTTEAQYVESIYSLRDRMSFIDSEFDREIHQFLPDEQAKFQAETADVREVFSQPLQGEFKLDGEKLKALVYVPHKVNENYSTHIQVKDIQAFDKQGKQLDFEFLNSSFFPPLSDKEQQKVGKYWLKANVTPLKWNALDYLGNIASLKADVTVKEIKMTPITTSWKALLNQGVEHDGIEIQLTPIKDSDNEYNLSVYNSGDKGNITPFSINGLNGTSSDLTPDVGPKWLSNLDKVLVGGTREAKYKIVLNSIPKDTQEITFFKFEVDDKPSAEQEITFKLITEPAN